MRHRVYGKGCLQTAGSPWIGVRWGTRQCLYQLLHVPESWMSNSLPFELIILPLAEMRLSDW